MRKSKKIWIFIVATCVLLCAILTIKPLLWKEKGEDRMKLALGQTYQNPFVLDQEWEDYGIGDPYVLRFDGKYYLYCSTKKTHFDNFTVTH